MQVSDNIFLGPVFAPSQPDPFSPSTPQNGLGPLGRIYVYDIVPAVVSAVSLGALQAATGGPFVLAAGANVTIRYAMDGTTRYILDTPRAVSVTASAANTATATVVGYDQYGQRMTELLAAPTTSTVTGKKAFKEILSITFSATPGSTVSAGVADVFGFPFLVSNPVYLASVKWDTALADNAATVVVGDGTAATSATGDVRGTITPTSASNGVRRLVCAMLLTGSQCGPQATRLAALGVNQA